MFCVFSLLRLPPFRLRLVLADSGGAQRGPAYSPELSIPLQLEPQVELQVEPQVER